MGDNRYIWFAEEHGGILKNADLVHGSLANHRRDELQRIMEYIELCH